MRVVSNERNIFVDVDDTLVMHRAINDQHPDALVIEDTVEVGEILMQINRPMVRLVKEEFSRGSHITVWSRGGWEWAKTVVDALGLTDHVHLVMTKPYAYFDDKPVEEWFTNRVYLPCEVKYKK